MVRLKFLSLLLLCSAVSCSVSAIPDAPIASHKELFPEDCEALLMSGERLISEYYMLSPKQFDNVRKYKYEMLDSFCKSGIGIFVMQLYLEMPVPDEYRAQLAQKTDKKFMYGIILIELRATPNYETNEVTLDYGSMQPLEFGLIH